MQEEEEEQEEARGDTRLENTWEEKLEEEEDMVE